MLTRLHIQNFILIDDLDVSFHQGLSVITGETGAGKSILIDALTVLLGARASKSTVRTGQEKTHLRAWFLINDAVLDLLKVLHPSFQWVNTLLIEKEIFLTGKSSAKINGQAVQSQFLKDVGDLLVDIHGQHEHQALLNSSKHVEMLDAFEPSIGPVLNKLYTHVQDYKEIELKLKHFSIDDDAANREIELLKYQIQDIESLHLQLEDEDLEKEYLLIKESETLLTALNMLEALFDGSEEQVSARSQMRHEHKTIIRYETLSKSLQLLSEQLNDLIYQTEDFAYQIKACKESVLIDEERLFTIEKRLDGINLLKRKYGNSVEAVLHFKNEAIERLEELENLSQLREKYALDKERVYQLYINTATHLANMRKKSAKAFESLVSVELKALNMERATFIVEFIDLGDDDGKYKVSKRGIEGVEFLVSFNPGEMVKPLKQVASGGEISRVMLALKVLFARQDLIPTLIFDEVDTGIGGKTASIVAEKLYQVSLHHQVLCISHVSQLAFMGDFHFLISKESNDKQTKTNLQLLGAAQREEELARMLGGTHQTLSTSEHVKEILSDIDAQKLRIRGGEDG